MPACWSPPVPISLFSCRSTDCGALGTALILTQQGLGIHPNPTDGNMQKIPQGEALDRHRSQRSPPHDPLQTPCDRRKSIRTAWHPRTLDHTRRRKRPAYESSSAGKPLSMVQAYVGCVIGAEQNDICIHLR